MIKAGIKCRWCSWTTANWYRTKDGQNKSGWPRLRAHMEGAHEEKVEELHAAVNAACPEEETSGK